MHSHTSSICYSSPVILYFNRLLEDLWLRDTFQVYFESARQIPEPEMASLAKFSESLTGGNQCVHQVRSAFRYWASLKQADRLTILQTYYRFFQQQMKGLNAEQINFTFCQIFLAEFSSFMQFCTR